MEPLYTSLAYLTAGVSLSAGITSIFIGLRKKEKLDLVFGMMALSLFVFLVLPPGGFILKDPAPHSAGIIFKRIFIFAYYALFPWFIRFYTGKGNSNVPLTISLSVIVCFGIMVFTPPGTGKPVWSMAAVPVFGAIALYGLVAGIAQYRSGEKTSAKWFISAMAIYGFLFLLTGINQLSDGFPAQLFGLKLFFPIHFHALLLMLIMGFRIMAEIFEKYQLEKLVKARDKRWKSFMLHAPVFVIELDTEGRILYINSFALKELGYTSAGELLNKNWFEMFSFPANVKPARMLFDKAVQEGKMIPYFQSTLSARDGREITVDWINYLTYCENDKQVLGVVSVGRDVTAGVSAQRLIDNLKLKLEMENVVEYKNTGSTEIIGSSKAIAYAIQKASQVAATNAPVLIEGETGVGKELFADLIHKLSSRNNRPMIKVNCGALPKDLVEDELFGHERGAFTTAIHSRKGRFELADGGTIFLDEIGELPLEMQPKLLRVLQNGEFEKVGGQKTIKVNVRVIAATNRNLPHEINQNRFREDLFYRLNVFPITVPAVRKRKEDLPELINYFISQKSGKYGKLLNQISKADLQQLIEYHWPGNVRELENLIERSVIASSGATLKLDWPHGEAEYTQHYQLETLDHIERNHILKIMDECHWKINGVNGAAEKLNMNPNTLRSKMKKLGINRPFEKSSEI